MTSNTSILFLCHSATPHVVQLRTAFAFAEHDPDIHWLVDDTQEEWSPPQIEDVRKMIGEMVLKPYQSAQSTFIIPHIDRASIPAQNALLKSLEEPPAHVRIVLTADQIENVLPTIQSRCVVVMGERSAAVVDEATVKQVLAITKLADIFALSEKYKERADAIALFEHVVRYLHTENQRTPTSHTTTQIKNFLRGIELLRKNVNVRLVVEDVLFN